MARNIFTFSIIVVYFLTIVSNRAFSGNLVFSNYSAKIASLTESDTISKVIHEDFESGMLSDWKQTTDWEVSAADKISGESSLKHLSVGVSGVSSIFHSVVPDMKSVDLEWKFTMKNGNWDPSSSNKFWFYLSADTIHPDLISGWAVGVNISGSSDLLSLWRIRKGKADSLIVQTDLDWNASTQAIINVKRSTRGQWTLNFQKSGDVDWRSFSGTDHTLFEFRNIGIYFKYTSTRAGQLWIDDISVNSFVPELFLQDLVLINSHLLSLTFSAPIDAASFHPGNFRLTDENGIEIAISRIAASQNSERKLEIEFGNVIGTELLLNVSGVSDFSGKLMQPDFRTFSYSFTPEIGSILINEILFNPFSGGADFVELVNVSEQIIPVHRLKLATRNDTLTLKQIYAMSTEIRYLYPGQFLVCTKDSAILSAQYLNSNPESFCTMTTLPSFPDDAGTVVLLNDSLEVLDEFSYSAKMQSPFLADENGVSLERISLEEPTVDRSNWASAAASVGFATPGLSNSQTENATNIQDEITPEPKAFSPNGDGYNDVLSINYALSKPGYIANVRIFDAAGRQVQFLVKNQSLAQQGIWQWDGKSESGQKMGIGIYIILVEVFDWDGNTKAFKKTCTLTDKFNL